MKGQMDDSTALPINAEVRDATASGTHTPEPWRYIRGQAWDSIRDARNLVICSDKQENAGSFKFNARRIVACVNFLQDVPNIILEAGAAPYSQVTEWHTQVVKQRDELAEALRECLGLIIVQNGNLHQDINKVIARADAVLTKLDTGTEPTKGAAT